MSDAAEPPSHTFAETLSQLLITRSFGKPLHFFPTIDSTNVYAARLAREGASAGTVVIADEQTGGKGVSGAIGSPLLA